jgi:1,4-alpha-glucan branching enzyme
VKDFAIEAYALGGRQRYSAKNVIRPTNFMYHDQTAKRVAVIGDFNDWHPDAHLMRHTPEGGWFLQIPLTHGPHHYLFLVDGHKRVMDPRAQGVVRNELNQKVSLIAVS